jgi:hypothetical protein
MKLKRVNATLNATDFCSVGHEHCGRRSRILEILKILIVAHSA